MKTGTICVECVQCQRSEFTEVQIEAIIKGIDALRLRMKADVRPCEGCGGWMWTLHGEDRPRSLNEQHNTESHGGT